MKDVVVGSWEVLLEQAQDYPLMERQWQLRPHQDQSNQRLDPIPPVDLVDRPNFPLRCCCCCTPNCCCSNRSKINVLELLLLDGQFVNSWQGARGSECRFTRRWLPVHFHARLGFSVSRLDPEKPLVRPKAALYRPLTKLGSVLRPDNQLNGGTQTQQQYHKVYVDGKGTQ